MPKISIVVPVYNGEPYLDECISSICRQTLQDIEIICVNDGSNDNSLGILQKYAANDQRIKIIDKENTGYGHSMNLGLDMASGDYLAIVESDDWIPEEMMQTLYEYAELNEVDFIKADFYRFVHQADGTVRKIYNHLAAEKYYNRVFCPSDEVSSFKFIMNIWSGIYRMDFIKKNEIRFNETPGASFQDNGFWFQTFALAKRAYFLDKPLYMNRRDNPLSSVNNKEKVYVACHEYDYIHGWVLNRFGNNRRYLYLCAEGRIRNYLFTTERIADEFKPDFYKRFKADYDKMLEAGEVAPTTFSDSWKKRVFPIVENPVKACEEDIAYRNKYMRWIALYSDIIIYGAGKCARKAFERLCEIGQRNRVAYFVVSERGKNPAQISDVPVVEVSQLSDQFKKEAFVIPAVSDAVYDEVLTTIRKQGFEHYITDKVFIEE